MRNLRGLAACLFLVGTTQGLSAQSSGPRAFLPVARPAPATPATKVSLGVPRPAPARFPVGGEESHRTEAGTWVSSYRVRAQQGEEAVPGPVETRTLPPTPGMLPPPASAAAKGPPATLPTTLTTLPAAAETNPKDTTAAPPQAEAVYPVAPVTGGLLRGYFARINPWTGLPWAGLLRTSGRSTPADPAVDPVDPFAEEASTVWAEPGAPLQRLQFGAEYLYWWTRGTNNPPLATTGNPLLPPQTAGSFRDPQAVVLYGGQNDPQSHSGARFYGLWWQDDGLWALEGGGFFLGEGHNRFRADESTFPVLARPFIGANPELAATPALAELVAYPGIGRGTLLIEETTRMSGFDVGIRRCLCSGDNWHLAGRVGLRHLNLEDELFIFEDVTALVAIPPSVAAGDRGIVIDNFGTRNRFWGGYVGLRGEVWWDCFYVEGNARVSLGNIHQTAQITGYQNVLRANGTRGLFPGGLLALPGRNIGSFSQNRFGVVPEVGIKVGCQVTSQVRAFVGYDFQFWNSVLRPGDQIDPRLDVSVIPNRGGGALTPVPVPTVPLRTTTFWAQGLNAGLEVRY